MNIYVGNLPWSIGEAQLKELFQEIGVVQQARLILDRQTGQSRGFGFVEMPDPDAHKAIERLNGKEIAGRTLRVNDAQKHPSSQ